MNTANTTPATYENRLILFIDFLGFSEMVERTVAQPASLDRIVKALRVLREIGAGQEDFQLFKTQQMTHFSDSVVVSFRVNEKSAVFWLLNEIALAVISLTGAGFLVRGAVTVGPLLHTPEVLIGPAMLEAYRLESKVAKSPRVLVTREVIAIGRQHHSYQHGSDEEERYIAGMLSEDPDQQLWIDYISVEAVLKAGLEPDAYPEYIAIIGRQVEAGLLHDCQSVREKFLWLHGHYLRVIDQFRALPPIDGDAGHQRAFIAALPDHEAIADARRKTAANTA